MNMTNDDIMSFQVPQLNESKFKNWSIKIKALLGAHVWEVMEKDLTLLENEATSTVA